MCPLAHGMRCQRLARSRCGDFSTLSSKGTVQIAATRPPQLTKGFMALPIVVVIAPVIGAIVVRAIAVIVVSVIPMPVIPVIVVAIPRQGRQRRPSKGNGSGQRQYALMHLEILPRILGIKAETSGLNVK